LQLDLLGTVAIGIVEVAVGRESCFPVGIANVFDPVGGIIGVNRFGAVGIADPGLFSVRGIIVGGGIAPDHCGFQAVTAVKGVVGGARRTLHLGSVAVGVVIVTDSQAALGGSGYAIKGVIFVIGYIGDDGPVSLCFGLAYLGDIVIGIILGINGADGEIGGLRHRIRGQGLAIQGIIGITEALALGIKHGDEVTLGVIIIGNGEIPALFILDMLGFPVQFVIDILHFIAAWIKLKTEIIVGIVLIAGHQLALVWIILHRG